VKRKHLIPTALVAAFAFAAFGAASAFGGTVTFNHNTGEMTYAGNDQGDTILDNDVKVFKDPLVSGWYVIDDVNGSNELFEGDDHAPYCRYVDYHGNGDALFWEESCPATHISIKTHGGDDKKIGRASCRERV